PVLVLLAVQGRLTAAALGFSVVAGVLSSVVPYAADLTALRYVPPRSFGVFMSVHPVLAAVVGLVLLGQVLDLHEWVGIAVVVLANAAAVALPRRGSAGSAVEQVGQLEPAGLLPARDDGAA
ncbi:EamA family transporter, partial [Modestobacter versicolor]